MLHACAAMHPGRAESGACLSVYERSCFDYGMQGVRVRDGWRLVWWLEFVHGQSVRCRAKSRGVKVPLVWDAVPPIECLRVVTRLVRASEGTFECVSGPEIDG